MAQNKKQHQAFKPGTQLIVAIILSILTYWLFAQSFLNIAPHVQKDYNIDMTVVNIAVSLTSLFTGIFIVVAGGLADKLGRVKMTRVGIILSIVGSISVIISSIPALLIIGRVLQGLSAACLMPATIAIINQFYHDEERQKALSFWSFGSYGGTGIASFFAGLVATFFGWKWIFVLSIILSFVALYLFRGVPESKEPGAKNMKFDVVGITIFLIMMLSINVVTTQGTRLGWLNPITLTLDAIFVISVFVFYFYERQKHQPFIDFSVFSNKTYIGTVSANFLLNTVIGSLALFNIYAQAGLGFSGLKAGFVTITYLIGSLSMICIGERYLQRKGPRFPMLAGPISIAVGILLISTVFLPDVVYIIVSVIGFLFIGLGLGFFATPVLDTALTSVPAEKVGVASGIIKMSSTLGAAFGIAILTTVYSSLAPNHTPEFSAGIAFVVGAAVMLSAFVASFVTIPKGKMEKQ